MCGLDFVDQEVFAAFGRGASDSVLYISRSWAWRVDGYISGVSLLESNASHKATSTSQCLALEAVPHQKLA